jgi:hypothetical protein
MDLFYGNGEIVMGLSMPVKSHKPPEAPETRERRGQAFTPHGRRSVRAGAFWLQQRWARQNLSFLTATIPSLPGYDLGTICTEWGEVVRRYKQELERELARQGIPGEVLLVTEIQEKRWRETGVIAPHLHIVFRGRAHFKARWAIAKERARELWENVLSAVLGYRVQAPASTRIERVKKSVECYLAKYMSKGGKVIQEIIDAGLRPLLPTAWWGMTNSLRKKVKDACIQVSEQAKNCIFDTKEHLLESGILQWFYVVTIEVMQTHGEPLKIPVCFVGKFARPEYRNMFVY